MSELGVRRDKAAQKCASSGHVAQMLLPLASGQPHREGMGALSLSCRASQILFMISGTRLSGSLPDYRSHQRLFGLLLASFTTAGLSMNAATGGTCLATAGGLRYPNPPYR